jgi:hypothetical protein
MDIKETGCDIVVKHDFVKIVRQILRQREVTKVLALCSARMQTTEVWLEFPI